MNGFGSRKTGYMHSVDRNWNEGLLAELEALDKEMICVDGKYMSPGQCYHIATDPPHILFNTNCPQELKDRIRRILKKYSFQKDDDDEDDSKAEPGSD